MWVRNDLGDLKAVAAECAMSGDEMGSPSLDSDKSAWVTEHGGSFGGIQEGGRRRVDCCLRK